MNLEKCKADFQNKYYEIIRSIYFSPRVQCKGEKNIKLKFDFSYRIISIDEVELKNDDNKGYLGALEFTVKSYLESNPKKAVLEVTVFGLFDGIGMERDSFKAMLELNGLTFLSQIMRTHILMATGGTGNKQIALPMINVTRIIEEHHSKESEVE